MKTYLKGSAALGAIFVAIAAYWTTSNQGTTFAPTAHLEGNALIASPAHPGVVEGGPEVNREPVALEAATKEACPCSSCVAAGTIVGGAGDSDAQPAARVQALLSAGEIEALFGEGPGNEVQLRLPDGKMMEAMVVFGRQENGEWVSITGTVRSPHEGTFYFLKNQSEGVAGRYSGFVRFDSASLAYAIENTADGVGAMLVEKTLGEVFCHGLEAMPRLKSEPASAKADDPTPGPIISLQSRPGAKGVIYLDFDGEKGPFPGWGNFDAKAPVTSDDSVRAVWAGVSEDFAPFDLNVTTDLAVYLAAPRTSRIQVVLTPTRDAAPGAGGVAYLNSFNWDDDKKVCWAFYAVGKDAVEVASHEVGHTLGLLHDGRTSPAEEYYGGHGSGAVGWAPIMGVGYYQQLSQWSKGEYKNPSRANQDDLAIITDNNNVDHVPDDHGDSAGTATNVPTGSGLGSERFSINGVISTPQDVDCFLIKIGGGTISLDATPSAKLSNLDILLEVYDLANNRLLSSNPERFIAANGGLKLKEGTYLVQVSGIGRGNPLTDGYTDYGSLGQYTLTGVVPRPPQALDDHGNSFVNATTVKPPQSAAGQLETNGDVDTFTFVVPTAATYVITSSGPTDVRGTLFSSRSIALASDDDGASNGNFRIRRVLTPGVYYVQVRAGAGSQTGFYTVEVAIETSDSPEIDILGFGGSTIPNKDQSPTIAEGNSFGIIAPNATKTQKFTVRNSGQLELTLTGSPLVKISGTHAAYFAVDSQPASSVAPGASSDFTIGYRPAKAGTHIAVVTVVSNDLDEGTYSFTIQGSAVAGVGDFSGSMPIEVPSGTSARIAEPAEVDLYRVNLQEAGYLVVRSTGALDTVGELYEGTGKFLQRDDDGGEGKNFRIARVLKPGIYFVRVNGRTAATMGDYNLVVEIEIQRPDIELIGLNNLAIANGEVATSTLVGTDFGTLNASSGFVNRTFYIKNTGSAVLNLTGNPSVAIEGEGADHFRVVTLPANPVGSGSLAPFIIRFNPATSGIHQATVSIPSDDPDESPYTFTIKGAGIGLPDDHEGTFEGATPFNFGEEVKGQIERVGDTDMMRVQVFQAGVVVISTTGSVDTSGVLFDANRRVIAKDEDGGEGSNFKISLGLKPGIYFVQVRGFGATATGPYVLHTGFN
jgi:archaellum component FlaG (FlaF/FlaG flagellin family)